MTERHLSRHSHQQVEAQRRDREHERPVDEQHPVGIPEEPESGKSAEGEQDENDDQQGHGDAFGRRREEFHLRRIRGEEERSASHTRRISSVPNSPYGLTRSTAIINSHGTMPANPVPSQPTEPR